MLSGCGFTCRNLMLALTLVWIGPVALAGEDVDAVQPGLEGLKVLPSGDGVEAFEPFDALVGAAELGDVRGGQGVAIDGDVGLNRSSQTSTINGNAITAPTQSGLVADNAITNNRGITISNFNSGNFNVFSTNVQMNVQMR